MLVSLLTSTRLPDHDQGFFIRNAHGIVNLEGTGRVTGRASGRLVVTGAEISDRSVAGASRTLEASPSKEVFIGRRLSFSIPSAAAMRVAGRAIDLGVASYARVMLSGDGERDLRDDGTFTLKGQTHSIADSTQTFAG
jgi:hypothetical protein